MVVSDSSSKSQMIGWLNIAFFGLGIVMAAKQLMDKKPRIVITTDGITDNTLKVGEVAWADICDAYLKRVQREHFICLQLDDEQKYLDRMTETGKKLAKANQMLGCESVNINLSGVKCDTGEILNTVKQRAAYARNR